MSPRILTAALLIALARTAAAAPADLATEFAAEAAVPGFLVPEGLTTRGSFADVLPLADGRVLLVTDSGPGGTSNSVPAALMLRGDGSVDTGFGSNGVFNQDVIAGVNVDGFVRVRATADGGFVVLAARQNDDQLDLIKLTPAGTLDTGFGENGRASLPAATLPGPGGAFQSTVVAQPLVVDAQDRILLATAYRRPAAPGDSSQRGVFAVCRFLPNGQRDPDYGTGGCATQAPADGIAITAGEQFSAIRGLALAGDEVILTGDAVVDGIGGRFGAVRLRADGTLDPAFGDGGILRRAPGTRPGLAGSTDGLSAGLGVAVRPDGRLLFVFSSSTAAGLLQLRADGTPDTAFGQGDGVASRAGLNDQDIATGPGPFAAVAGDVRGLVLQPDGKALVLSRISVGGSDPFTGAQVGRFLASGLQDTGFGEISTYVRGSQNSITANVSSFALAADGAVFVTGGRGGATANPAAPFVAKLRGGASLPVRAQDFTLDDPVGVPPASTVTSNPITIAGLPDGVPALARIVNGRFTINGASDGSGNDSIRLVRNGDVIVVQHTSAPGPGARTISRLIIGADDDAVVENFISTTVGPLACLPGELDGSFAPGDVDGDGPRAQVLDGVRVIDLGTGEGAPTQVLALPDSRVLLIAGRPADWRLARFTAQGEPDPEFGAGSGQGVGQARVDLVGDVDLFSNGAQLAAQRLADGKLLIAGQGTRTGAGTGFAVVRLFDDGRVDASFGAAGVAFLPHSAFPTTFRSGPTSLVVQDDGRILVAGLHEPNAGSVLSDFVLWRLNADGSPDDGSAADRTPGDGFGINDGDPIDGAVVSRQARGAQNAVVRLQDGRPVLMVAAGNPGGGFVEGHYFYRFGVDGNPDPSFGTAGERIVPDTNPNLSLSGRIDLQVLEDGRLLFTSGVVALGQLTADGDPDTGFGVNGDGLILRDFGGAGGSGAQGLDELTSALRSLAGEGLLLQPDGKRVVRGAAGFQGPMQLARFFADGTPDLGFADDLVQIATVQFGHRNVFGSIASAIDPLGRIVIVDQDADIGGGGEGGSRNSDHVIARLCGGASVSTRVSPFTLEDRSGVARNSTQTSNTITIAGLPDGVPALVRIVNGTYSKGCGSGFTSAMEKVVNGDTLCVRHVAASLDGTSVTTTLILGADADEFRETFVTTTGGVAPSPAPTPTPTPAPTPTPTPSPTPAPTPTPTPTPIPNRAPIAVDDAATLDEDGRIDLSVLANDRDPDGDALTLDGFTQPAAGTVTQLLPLQVLRYTPNPDANGSDSFVYAVRDGRGGVASARVNLTIRPVNDAPVLGDDRFEMFAGNVLTADVLANDRDPEGEPLSGAGGTPPANGQAGLFPVDGRLMLRYQPNAGFTGDDTFAYRLRDPAGAVGSANVTVTVRPRLPSGQLRLVAGRFEDTGPSRSQTASLGNRVLTCALREQQDDGGIEARITDALTSVTGPGLRTLAWADGESGARCASVFVGEQPRASTPALAGLRLVDDRDGSVAPPRTTAPEQSARVEVAAEAVTAGAAFFVRTVQPGREPLIEVNESAGSIRLRVARAPASVAGAVRVLHAQVEGGTTAVAGVDFAPLDARVTWAAGESDAREVELRILDNDIPGQAARQLLVVLADDDPADADGTGVLAQPYYVLIRIADDDGPAPSPTPTPTPTAAPTPSPTPTPAPTAAPTPPPTPTPTPTAAPTPSPTPTPTAAPTPAPNRLPVARDDSISVAEDGVADIAALGNDIDPDGDPLSIGGIDPPAHGSVTLLAPLRELRYTPDPDFNGTDRFAYTVSDGRGGTASAVVSVLVTPVNDAPVAAADRFRVTDDPTAVTLDVLANDVDVDGDALRVVAVTPPARGAAILLTGGAGIRFEPAADVIGELTLDYTVADGQGATAQATVTIEVVRGERPNGELRFQAATLAALGGPGVGDFVLNTLRPAFGCLLRDEGSRGAVSVRVDRQQVGAVAPQPQRSVQWDDGDRVPRCLALQRDPDRRLDAVYALADPRGGARLGAPRTLRLRTEEFAPIGSVRFRDPPRLASTNYAAVDVAENAGTVTLQLLRTATATTPAARVRVMTGLLATDPGPAQPQQDFEPLDRVVEFAQGQTEATVTVTILDDAEREQRAPEEFFVFLADADGSATTAAPNALRIRIVDDDADTGPAGNRAPIAVDDRVEIVAGTPEVSIAVLANDRDPDGDALTIEAPAATPGGTLVVAADAIRYRPADGFTGQDGFSYTVRDPSGEVATARVEIVVTPRDDRVGFIGSPVLRLAEGETQALTVARTAQGTNLPAASATLAVTAGDGSRLRIDPAAVRWAAGETGERRVSVEALDDAEVSDVRAFVVALTGVEGTSVGTAVQRRVIVTDDDLRVGFEAPAFSHAVAAGDAAPVFIERSGRLGVPLAVTLTPQLPDGVNARGCVPAASGGTPVFFAAPTRAVFAPGQSRLRVDLPLRSKAPADTCRYARVELSTDAPSAQLAVPSAEVVLESADARVVAFTSALQTVREGDCAAQAVLAVASTATRGLPVSLGFAYTPLDAEPAVDFVDAPGQLEAAAADDRVGLPLLPLDDARVEPVERYRIRVLGDPDAAVPVFVGTQDTTTVAVLDDDTAVIGVPVGAGAPQTLPAAALFSGCELTVPADVAVLVFGAEGVDPAPGTVPKAADGTTSHAFTIRTVPDGDAGAIRGAAVLAEFRVDPALSNPGYYACSDRCYPLEAARSADGERLRVVLEDGGVGDADGVVNGRIAHRGRIAPAGALPIEPPDPVTPVGSETSGGGGAMSLPLLGWAVLAALMAALMPALRGGAASPTAAGLSRGPRVLPAAGRGRNPSGSSDTAGDSSCSSPGDRSRPARSAWPAGSR